jgi:dipeptidyl aminopeptidase/acylaminoacyl peptidase
MARLAVLDAPPAVFSPNGNRFAILIKKGNLAQNTNDFSLLVYRTADALNSPKPNVLLKMSSSSNREAIKEIKWLNDSRTIVFLGETPGSLPQVYSVNVLTKRLQQLTNSPNEIHNYDIGQNGFDMVYATDQSKTKESNSDRNPPPVAVVEGRTLSEFLRSCMTPSNWPKGDQLYVQHGRRKPILVPLPDDYLPDWGNPLYMSPDGKYSLVGVLVRQIPPGWAGYQNARLQQRIKQLHPPGQPVLFLGRYLLLNTKEGSTKPLLNTPMTQFAHVAWKTDGTSVFLKDVFLPLNIGDPIEREERTRKTYQVEVHASTGKLRTIENADWPRDETPLKISVREDRNTPPKIYVGSQPDSRLLLDLNPWLNSVDLAHVDVVEWQTTDARRVNGELFLPRDYVVGRRYPLVIQTHGFAPDRFLIDGPFDSSAFAAQALAARGLLVLQMDYGRSVANTTSEGPTEMAAYEGAIDELDKRGLIDRERVGIVGFSRTVFQVGYALTHSKYRFRAATLVDGIDAGYLQYLGFGPGDNVHLNGGQPFGDGLKLWLANSPAFQLANVRTPVRLEAHGCSHGILGSWEWFAILSDLGRPVELAYVPDAPHIVVRPREKLACEAELVDWFSFWLGSEAQNSLESTEQGRRWEELRKKQKSVLSLD